MHGIRGPPAEPVEIDEWSIVTICLVAFPSHGTTVAFPAECVMYDQSNKLMIKLVSSGVLLSK
jgi:hypothetical protein